MTQPRSQLVCPAGGIAARRSTGLAAVPPMCQGKIQAVVAGDFIGLYLTGTDMQQMRAKVRLGCCCFSPRLSFRRAVAPFVF